MLEMNTLKYIGELVGLRREVGPEWRIFLVHDGICKWKN